MYRIIPCLLLKDKGLVKTYKFNKPRYIGDPVNTVKIFNEKEVDELICILGISSDGILYNEDDVHPCHFIFF